MCTYKDLWLSQPEIFCCLFLLHPHFTNHHPRDNLAYAWYDTAKFMYYKLYKLVQVMVHTVYCRRLCPSVVSFSINDHCHWYIHDRDSCDSKSSQFESWIGLIVWYHSKIRYDNDLITASSRQNTIKSDCNDVMANNNPLLLMCILNDIDAPLTFSSVSWVG